MTRDTINNLQTFDSDFTPTTAELKEGQSLGENRNYRLEKNLGAGGMGEVWLASEIRGGQEVRKVVVKTLRPDRRGNEGAQEKALKQFQLIQSLNHTNICPIYVIEKDPACGYLVVMGYANGGSYADWFAQQPKENGGLPLKTVCDVLRPIADALDFMHSKGIIHRDVKPENMMFASDGTPWLIDFGIAANLRTATQATQGQFSQSGTVSYMAPEQRTGQLQTAQTDEYALALVALEFLTGTTFLQAVQTLQLEIQRVLNKALALKPSNRFPTCRAFIDALEMTAFSASPNSNFTPVATGSTVPAPQSAIEQIVESERLAAEAKRRAKEEAHKERVQILDKSAAEEYQAGRYAEAIAHLNELLKLKPDHPKARWLLEQANQKMEIQQTERKAREVEAWQEYVRKAREKAGVRKVLKAKGVEYAFRWCPPGEFMMGGRRKEFEALTFTLVEKSDQHQVKLTKGFWLLETPVTQMMWTSLMGKNPSWFRKGLFVWSDDLQRPVEQVSWNDCQDFCQMLSQKLGRQVQLPTEAQWEYACRAGTTGDYAGDLDAMAWYKANCGAKTHAVGQKKPNAWGLYDMHGNIWEWCSDSCGEELYGGASTSAPKKAAVPEIRVYRGGSYYNDADFCLSASRLRISADCRSGNIGFRILLVPTQEEEAGFLGVR